VGLTVDYFYSLTLTIYNTVVFTEKKITIKRWVMTRKIMYFFDEYTIKLKEKSISLPLEEEDIVTEEQQQQLLND
jgi:hypothetical protein